MVVYRAWTKELTIPRTEEEKARIYKLLRHARELRDEDERNGYHWNPSGEEVSVLREERENEIG